MLENTVRYCARHRLGGGMLVRLLRRGGAPETASERSSVLERRDRFARCYDEHGRLMDGAL